MSTYQPGFDNHPDIAAVKVQMVQLNQSVTTFTFITQDTLESFLWEAMLELWARHRIRDLHPDFVCYDFFCAWFPEFVYNPDTDPARCV